MAYTFAEVAATTGTPGAAATCIVPMDAAGPIRDVVSNKLALPRVGYYNRGGSGHPGKVIAAGFSAGSYSGDCYRHGPGCPSLVIPGRGTSTYPRTVWGVFRVREFAQTNADVKSVLLGLGTSNAGSGIGVQVSSSGDATIAVGDSWNGLFWGPGITLTRNRWYLIALTYLSDTSRLLQVYDLAAATYVTPQSTGSAYTSSGTGLYDTDDVVIGQTDLMFDCAGAGVSPVTFAPGTNNFFAQLVTDPFAASKGAAYTPSGGLTAPAVAWKDSTTATVEIHSTRPTGGASINYQYRLHRLPDTATSPSTATRVTSLQASPILVDTTATTAFAGYQVEVTDGTTTVYSAMVFGHATNAPDAYFALIGDSRAVWGQALANNLRAGGRMAAVQNFAHGSTAYYSTTVPFSWQPNTTQDPTNGQSGTFLLRDTIAGMQESGITNVIVDLGANDIASNIAGATFSINAARVVNYLVAQGFKVYLNASFARNGVSVYSDMVARVAALANGTTILFNNLDALAVSNGLDSFSDDGLHLTQPAVSQFPAIGFQKYLEASGGATFATIGSSFIRGV